jgi:hypothetical protein
MDDGELRLIPIQANFEVPREHLFERGTTVRVSRGFGTAAPIPWRFLGSSLDYQRRTLAVEQNARCATVIFPLLVFSPRTKIQ